MLLDQNQQNNQLIIVRYHLLTKSELVLRRVLNVEYLQEWKME